MTPVKGKGTDSDHDVNLTKPQPTQRGPQSQEFPLVESHIEEKWPILGAYPPQGATWEECGTGPDTLWIPKVLQLDAAS